MEESAAAAAREESPLLRCLSQMNGDVLTAYLLPKLIRQGSAGAVALTCSQLCRLCQGSIQHLDLTKQLSHADNPTIRPKFARQLGAAFSNCTSLDLACQSGNMKSAYNNISQLLAGLPGLNTISIKLDDAGKDGSLDPVLGLLHLHATALRCLRLQLDTSWEKHHKTWGSFGQMDSLTKLELSFDSEVKSPCTQIDLLSLTSLTKLQSLAIKAPGSDWLHSPSNVALQLAAQQVLGHLTSLTTLVMPFEVVSNISSISACTSLCDLQLRLGEKLLPRGEGWRAQEWVAVAQLSCLTRLHIGLDPFDNTPSEAVEFYGVLRQLTKLRRVGANYWAASALPVLQSLTHLTAVDGLWDARVRNVVGELVCPHIRELGETCNVPYEAFPYLLSVTYARQPDEDLEGLSHCCTALQRFALTDAAVAKAVKVPHKPWDLTGIRSLARLQHLTHLELACGNGIGLLAFTTAAARTPKLRCLHVHGPLPFYALMQLQSLRGLQELTVHITSKRVSKDSFTDEFVRMLLVSLAGVPKVCLVVRSREQLDVVAAARHWADEWELPLPAVLKVSRRSS